MLLKFYIDFGAAKLKVFPGADINIIDVKVVSIFILTPFLGRTKITLG